MAVKTFGSAKARQKLKENDGNAQFQRVLMAAID